MTPTPTAHSSFKKGVGINNGVGTAEQIRDLGATWGYNWRITLGRFNDLYQYVPMIFRDINDPPKVISVTQEHPGSYWLIWNEPERYNQTNISWTVAANIYHDLRPFILSHDPTAKLIVGGLAYPSGPWPGFWAANFREAYRSFYGEYPVVEGWHIHMYPAAPYSKHGWRQPIIDFARWMTGTGEGLELWVSEFGHLDSAEVGAQIMQDQVPWMEDQPWITRYAWFATDASPRQGSLLNPDGSRTWLGELYRGLP